MHAKLILAGALLLSCFAAQATDANGQVASNDETPKAASAGDNDSNCLRYTGSIIVASENQRNKRARNSTGSDTTVAKPKCSNNAGRSYNQDDLRRTGQPDIGRALQMLDPSVTLGH